MPKVLNFHKTGIKALEVRAAVTEAEIDIFGPIGSYWFDEGVSAKTFRDEIKKIPDSVKNITVNLNSPGGDVFDGIAIYNMLKQHPAQVKVKVQALAASIASIIALAGDEIEMGEGSMFMIHLPWTFAGGNRIELDRVSDQLIKLEEQMISIYAKKSSLSRSEIQQMLEEETWLDATESVEMKFATSKTEEGAPIAASVLGAASWITKMPKNLNTQTEATRKTVIDLKNKIEGFLAR